ncbi:hypothetical protein AB0K09_28510 [Streptomyces sp. NPDC049577]|uniref:hypothetical protein n=1 Tax=Streptomyces sp. NPDC049577 TaxID=3155153 RepID=UPI00342D7509
MPRRTLEALGLHIVPALHPLTYPGRPVPGPSLLTGRRLLPLRPGGTHLGAWLVRNRTLDDVLGPYPAAVRHPVLAVGSNASPAQLAHKFRRLAATVPMVPARTRGIAVGCSAHIGRAGYVAAAPYADPDAERTLVISWLDAAQLAAVDATEIHYHRVLLPGGAYPMTLPSGERLGGAYLYVSRHGVLLDPATRRPRPGGGDQAVLLAGLLRASPRLRALLGPDPEHWVERTAADPAVRAEGTRIFAEEGWVGPEGNFPRPAAEAGGPAPGYGDLAAHQGNRQRLVYPPYPYGAFCPDELARGGE